MTGSPLRRSGRPFVLGLLAAGLLALPAARAFAVPVPAASVPAGPVPAALWAARLWLTAQAFGLEEDCPVGLLFQDPAFRSTPLAGGGAVTSRLVSRRMKDGDLFLTVETLRAGLPVSRVTLQLRDHPDGGVASVESITMGAPGDAGPRTIRYAEAVNDDDEYDAYTDTLVSLYTAFFDEEVVRSRALR